MTLQGARRRDKKACGPSCGTFLSDWKDQRTREGLRDARIRLNEDEGNHRRSSRPSTREITEFLASIFPSFFFLHLSLSLSLIPLQPPFFPLCLTVFVPLDTGLTRSISINSDSTSVCVRLRWSVLVGYWEVKAVEIWNGRK